MAGRLRDFPRGRRARFTPGDITASAEAVTGQDLIIDGGLVTAIPMT